MKDLKERLGIVYSTNPDYQYQTDNTEETATLPNEKQRLTVTLDKRNRSGKTVTLISGFIGTDGDLDSLARMLKTKCGTGGTAKDGQIIMQGDLRTKITEILKAEHYKVK
jgi:translation initiation factor 1